MQQQLSCRPIRDGVALAANSAGVDLLLMGAQDPEEWEGKSEAQGELGEPFHYSAFLSRRRRAVEMRGTNSVNFTRC